MLQNSSLQGISIPGVQQPVKATLFADDTTTYLHYDDSWNDLQEILGKWCRASKARFNIGKTEVVPIGSPEFRKTVIENKKINANSPIPNNIKIAEEGESIRILGAWIGNHISPEDVWTKLIDRIEYELFLWENRHPDLIARRHILNTVLVSTTQYKTQVNGMPKDVLKRLTKVLNKFIWKGSAPMINMETLQK
ncbi:uncharacterized protein STEHIDRAFT_33103, partial [Stereum hirsutum FP-91666 SS1]|uniref:uncharacterized protein n=1 Tax=Stereum hirsutum (strain FP-91666) TaxID=721885 RepID=UPI0004409E30